MSLELDLTPYMIQLIQDLLDLPPSLKGEKSLSNANRMLLQNVLTSINDEKKSTITLDELEILTKQYSDISFNTLISGTTIRVPTFEQKNTVIHPQQEIRKKNLKLRAQEREFARMVSNVDSRQLHAKKHRNGAAVSLQSASFGLHIIIGMACGFLAGYLLTRTVYSGSQTVRVVGGVVGMVGTLIMEVVLYIIRDEKARLKSLETLKTIKEGKLISASSATPTNTNNNKKKKAE
jgi:hypothetical protein